MVGIRELNYADDTLVRGYYDSYVAAERARNPAASVHSYAETTVFLRGPSVDSAFQVLAAVDERSAGVARRIVGGAMSIGSSVDNLHACSIAVHVRSDPRAVGGGLLRGRHRLTAVALVSGKWSESAERVTALCSCVVSEDGEEFVDQWATIVDRAHRGHRLGMAVKIACYRLLDDFAADKSYVATGNAETSRWMISINEDVGFTVHSTVGVFLKRRFDAVVVRGLL